MNFIIFCCAGSAPVIGVMCCCQNWVTTIRMGRRYHGSGADRSLIHPNQGAPRSSIETCSAAHIAIMIGNVNRTGMQPLAGLTFFSR